MISKFAAVVIKGYQPSESELRQWGFELLQEFHDSLQKTEDLLFKTNRQKEVDEVMRQVYAVLRHLLLADSQDENAIKKAKQDFERLKKNASKTLHVNLERKHEAK